MEMLAAIMFVLALVMLHSSLGKVINQGINCTFPELKYSIINKTSGSDEVIACSKCRKCGLGKELKVPCGTTLGINEGHGGCNDCGEGMYSDADDASPCKVCRYRLCLKHQLYKENCTKEKDDSHCLPDCEAGYIWNKEYSNCEVDLPELKNHTTMPSSTLPPTTKPADLNDAKVKTNEHPFTVIVGAVIGGIAVVVVILIFVIAVCYRCKILEPNPQVDTEESDLPKIDKPEQSRTYATQEEFSEVNESSKATVLGVPTKESFHEFEQTLNESDSASNSSVEPTTLLVQPRKPNTPNHGTNNRCYSNTLLTNSPVGVDPHVIPLTHMVQNRLAGPLFLPTHAVRFETLLAATYDEICLKFNAGPAGKNWRDLAGWLGLSCEDVNRIKLQENKTDHVIRRWAVAAENTVNRFLEILEQNEMTCLALTIRAELNFRNI